MSAKCHDPWSGRLLTRYELELVTEEEAERFEAHVLRCESCYRQLTEGIPLVMKLRSLIQREPRPAPLIDEEA